MSVDWFYVITVQGRNDPHSTAETTLTMSGTYPAEYGETRLDIYQTVFKEAVAKSGLLWGAATLFFMLERNSLRVTR
jgi:hypothetical protein